MSGLLVVAGDCLLETKGEMHEEGTDLGGGQGG